MVKKIIESKCSINNWKIFRILCYEYCLGVHWSCLVDLGLENSEKPPIRGKRHMESYQEKGRSRKSEDRGEKKVQLLLLLLKYNMYKLHCYKFLYTQYILNKNESTFLKFTKRVWYIKAVFLSLLIVKWIWMIGNYHTLILGGNNKRFHSYTH